MSIDKDPNHRGYAANRKTRPKVFRMVIEISNDLLASVDGWGVASGMTSRAETVRELLKKGLAASLAQPQLPAITRRITGPDSDGDYWLHLSKGDNAAGINLGKPFGQVGGALLSEAAQEDSK